MSFPISLTCFRNRKEASFTRQIFDVIFLPFCSNRKEYASDPGFMQVEYPDGSRADISICNLSDEALAMFQPGKPLSPERISVVFEMPRGDPRLIQNVTFNHCGGNSFFDAMYKLADHTNSVISWPALEPKAVVPNEATLAEVPSDYPGIRAARIVRNGAEIADAIESG